MLGLQACWSYLIYYFNLITLSPLQSYNGNSLTQYPLLADTPPPKPSGYPIFDPPNGPQHGQFKCEYPELPDYEFCSTHEDRGCWLRPKDRNSKKQTYNIFTNYEDIYPKGKTRKYTLDITTKTLYPDGCENTEGKVFNASYPGPWIEACWGDDIEVTVRNHLPCNGTTIHWHGLRQFNNVENDGVNAVTQCPIAPGDSYTYKFHARQYGTSWYHSHYSLQYGDGLAGPLTIHGPSSANYDTSIDPILMTDWNQRSAFQDWAWSINNGSGFRPPTMTSILLNGEGVAPPGTCKDPQPAKLHTIYFQKGVRYLLRLINTSVDTTFIFSIDGHNLTVVETDFVPIHNYTTESVLIGIGQRYHVIVEAKPTVPTKDGNYWMRTVPADGCKFFKDNYYNVNTSNTGIVRYDPNSKDPPTSQNLTFPLECSDEPYGKLKPIYEWTVPQNNISDNMDVHLVQGPNTDPYYPQWPGEPNFRRWQLYKGPLWLNFSDPTVLNVNANTNNFTAELSVNTKISDKDQWIELLITGLNSAFAAHPIHLHGHDFALLAQSDKPWTGDPSVIKRDNPPRRDVALLRKGGYLLIAFKVDNPGVWLMHCHIAWHASSGLAMQILENTDRMVLHDKPEMNRICKNWDTWYGQERLKEPLCQKWDQKHFQDDSGI